MTTEVIPHVIIHEIITGNQFTGVAPSGANMHWTEEELFRGRLQQWQVCTTGGLIAAPAREGMRVEQVSWQLDSPAANIYIYLVDDHGVDYQLHAETGVTSGTFTQRNGGVLVPPTFSLRFTSNQNMNAATAVAGEGTGVTGDGVTATYTITTANRPVQPTTVSLVAGTVTFTDAAGVLTGAGGSGGTGTIDYNTGVMSVTFNDPTDFAVLATVSYSYYSIGRVLFVTGQGWGQPAPSQIGLIGKQNLPPAKGV